MFSLSVAADGLAGTEPVEGAAGVDAAGLSAAKGEPAREWTEGKPHGRGDRQGQLGSASRVFDANQAVSDP